MKTLVLSASIAFLMTISLSGCISTAIKAGDADAKTVATGSAGGANSQNANSQLPKCDKPLGTAALIEDRESSWYQILTGQYKLTSTVPLLRLMMQQSNCFVVVDRGRAMNNMKMERELMSAGESRAGSNFGKGQMVSADYTITPEVIFSQKGGSGMSGGVGGGLLGAAVGLLGSMKTNEASAMLTMVDNRSGVQVGAAEGSAANTDFALSGLISGGGAGGGLGGYSNTPEGKVIAGAFMNAYVNMVQAAKNYTPQTMGDRGLGTGGKLNVDGASQQNGYAGKQVDLKEAQSILSNIGYDVGPSTGKANPKTTAALKQFQKDVGLPITGRLDKATIAELAK